MNNQFLRVLSIKPFLFLWLAELFSQLAGNIINFILIFAAFELTNSNTAASGVVIAFTLPAIFFGAFAGVLVDHWNKKKVLFVTNAIRAVLLVTLVLFHENLAAIYFFAFTIMLVTQFFIPAETPMIPILVPQKQLMAANALFGMGIYGSILVGYALSGVFLILFGKSTVFLILALFFWLAAFFVTNIKTSHSLTGVNAKNTRTSSRSIFAKELSGAFSVIAKTRNISHSLFLLSLSQVLILVLASIGPGFAKEVLKIHVDEFPLLFITPAALGMVTGAILIGNFLYNQPKHKMATLGLFLSGSAILFMPYISALYMTAIFAFVLGIANSFVFVPSNTILQEETAEHIRGKVYGVLNSLVGIFSLIPIMLVGGFADLFGVSSVLTTIAALLILIGALRMVLR